MTLTECNHVIWVKVVKDTKVFYSEMYCFNPDFYMNMMSIEFDIEHDHKKIKNMIEV